MRGSARKPRPDETAVIARYPEMEDARRAFIALQNQGVDPADIRLAGRRAEATEHRATRHRVRDRIDRRLAGHVLRRVIAAAALGALAGAAIGALVGSIAVLVLDDVATVALFVLIMLIPAVLGAVLTVFLTFERSVGVDDTWQLMFDDMSEDDVCVAVRVRDDEETERVLSTLRRHEPPVSSQVRRATAEGVHTVRAG